MDIKVDEVLDCAGLSCPMPVVKTKKAVDGLTPGQVLEVKATDKGSLADLKGWSKRTGHQYIGVIEEEGVFKHYIRKSRPEHEKKVMSYPHTISNDELYQKLGAEIIVLDVREEAEYFFGHIKNAISIPFGELEARANELNKEADIYVICRTGSRSDMACHLLEENGFIHVYNVVPGMSEWTYDIEKN